MHAALAGQQVRSLRDIARRVHSFGAGLQHLVNENSGAPPLSEFDTGVFQELNIGRDACRDDPHLLAGLNTHAGKLTNFPVGQALTMDVLSPKLALNL